MRQKIFLCALLLTTSDCATAMDLSGFYRCSGTKTVLSTKIAAPMSISSGMPAATAPGAAAGTPTIATAAPNINQNGSLGAPTKAPANVDNSAPLPGPVPAPTNNPNAANPTPGSTANTPANPGPVKIKINPPATASGALKNSAPAPAAPTPAPVAPTPAPVAPTPAAPPMPRTSSGNAPQNDSPILSSGADDNAIPVAALLNLRTLEGGDGTYVYQQMNDDGSVFWGLFYYDASRLIGGFHSRTKQLKEYQGAASLNVNPEDGTFAGQFYIENVVRGNVTCSKL